MRPKDLIALIRVFLRLVRALDQALWFTKLILFVLLLAVCLSSVGLLLLGVLL